MLWRSFLARTPSLPRSMSPAGPGRGWGCRSGCARARCSSAASRRATWSRPSTSSMPEDGRDRCAP
eukprot:12916551-Prorocentrum_lima.AAC.1